MFGKIFNKDIDIMVVIIFVVSLLLLINSYVSSWSSSFSPDPAGPAFLPRVVLILLFLSSLLLLRRKKRLLLEYSLNASETWFFLLFVITSAALPYSSWKVGIDISIFIYLSFWMYLFGFKSINRIIIYSILGAIFITYFLRLAGSYIPHSLISYYF